MKKRPFFLIVPIILTLASCLEITEYVGQEKNQLTVDLRITIQKALFAMASGMGGGTENPMDSFDPEELRKSFPEGVVQDTVLIDTELETGVSIRLRYKATELVETSNASLPVLLPYRDGKTLVVDLKQMNNSSSAETNQMATAIMSGFKYRLLISKSVLTNPKKAWLVSEAGTTPITLIQYPELAIVELSMSYILGGQAGSRLIVE